MKVYLILLCFALLRITETALFFFLINGRFVELCIEQVCWHHFSNSIILKLSYLHFLKT